MSEVKLNIIDSQQTVSGTIHGSVADACVAALSAEPETIAELTAALARFNKPVDGRSPFLSFRAETGNSSLDTTPWDAGLVIIDMAARIVAVESTYSNPQPGGEVHYHDGTAATDIPIRYRLPDDWLFVNSVEAYSWSRERRYADRKTPIDARKVLYGTPLLEFITDECARLAFPPVEAGTSTTDFDAMYESLSRELSVIHARWLMTPRDDLGNQSPRELMLEKQDLIGSDLESRSLQWSLLDEGPPCLSPDSFAYRFAGFGIHEWIIYYKLVRHLLWSARTLLSSQTTREKVIAQLEELKTGWLEEPQDDYDGRIPAILIDNERKRLPIAMRPRDMIIDDDCPVCQMLGDETSPLGMGVGFWHLDGSSMDDDFAFSFYKTREEWEAENLRYAEHSREFNRRWEERQQRIARGEVIEHDPFLDPDPFPDFEFENPGLPAEDAGSEDKESSH